MNTFIHSRSFLENHTRLQTKMGKVYTRFQAKTAQKPCLVRVRRFPSPSRSIRSGDVSEANGRETFSHGPRDPKRFGREEK